MFFSFIQFENSNSVFLLHISLNHDGNDRHNFGEDDDDTRICSVFIYSVYYNRNAIELWFRTPFLSIEVKSIRKLNLWRSSWTSIFIVYNLFAGISSFAQKTKNIPSNTELDCGYYINTFTLCNHVQSDKEQSISNSIRSNKSIHNSIGRCNVNSRLWWIYLFFDWTSVSIAFRLTDWLNYYDSIQSSFPTHDWHRFHRFVEKYATIKNKNEKKLRFICQHEKHKRIVIGADEKAEWNWNMSYLHQKN